MSHDPSRKGDLMQASVLINDKNNCWPFCCLFLLTFQLQYMMHMKWGKCLVDENRAENTGNNVKIDEICSLICICRKPIFKIIRADAAIPVAKDVT